MAVTITRTAWTDDDGSGTTGTVINNAVKTELYGQIDTALALLLPLAGGTISGTLAVTGAATLSSTLTVAGLITAGSLAAGTVTLIGALVAASAAIPKFKTASGSTGSITSGVATTIFSMSGSGVASRFEVAAAINSTGNPTNYAAIATVVFDGSDGRIIANNGGGLTITLSGTNVQVEQSTGGAANVNWVYTKLAA